MARYLRAREAGTLALVLLGSSPRRSRTTTSPAAAASSSCWSERHWWRCSASARPMVIVTRNIDLSVGIDARPVRVRRRQPVQDRGHTGVVWVRHRDRPRRDRRRDQRAHHHPRPGAEPGRHAGNALHHQGPGLQAGERQHRWCRARCRTRSSRSATRRCSAFRGWRSSSPWWSPSWVRDADFRPARELYAIGSNPMPPRWPDTKRATGIRGVLTSGALAGLGGALFLALFAQVDNSAGLGYELNVVAAAVVGGSRSSAAAAPWWRGARGAAA